MRSILLIGVAVLTLPAATAALAAPSVEIRDAVARVVVIPEARQDVAVEMITVNKDLPLFTRHEGGRVVLLGRLRRRIGSCSTDGGKPAVHVRGVGQVSYDNMPQIVVRTPMDVRVGASGAVFGSIGRADDAELSNAGCGDWTVANVKGDLKINEAGSGDTRAGGAGSFVAHVAGSGDVTAQDILGGATIDVAGSGDVSLLSISGPLHVSIAGSGDVKIDRGHAAEMVVHVAGSGGVRFGGTADSLNTSIAGSGDVDVGRVTGPVKKAILGSGDVNVGH